MKRIALALALLAAGCTSEKRSSVEVLGHAAPTSADTCTYDPGGKYVLGDPLFDLQAPPAFDLAVYAMNNLADPKETNAGALTASKDWNAEAVRVRYNPSDYVDTYGPSSLAPVRAETVRPVSASPVLTPAGGKGILYLEDLIDSDIITQLSGLPAARYRLVLGLTVEGHTNDGARLDTGEWFQTVWICNGCTVGMTCPTGTTLTLASHCDGQIWQNECVKTSP